ncbi:PadR family transcriptional regulator [Evansella halocellulosilytica]|uniref:PadR family transcriptional regulator n=1 Tax=Evansella halocellulosilytica TaxID=2011013 RepID=UPI000BB72C0C
MEIDKEMLRGNIDIIILSSLFREELYGYELAKQITEKTEGKFELKEGTLYLAFKRLEKNGLIQSYWGKESVGGRRKYYRLLPEGRAFLKQRKRDFEVLTQVVELFLKGVNLDD